MTAVSPPLRFNDPRLDQFAHDHYVAICVFMPLTTLAIVLRFYARRNKGTRFSLDDAFALLSYIIFVVFASIVIYGKSLYANTHNNHLREERLLTGVACKNGAIGHVRAKLPPLNRARASKVNNPSQ